MVLDSHVSYTWYLSVREDCTQSLFVVFICIIGQCASRTRCQVITIRVFSML